MIKLLDILHVEGLGDHFHSDSVDHLLEFILLTEDLMIHLFDGVDVVLFGEVHYSGRGPGEHDCFHVSIIDDKFEFFTPSASFRWLCQPPH